MTQFLQGSYKLRNPQKYVGKGQPRYRSGWEWKFFQFCDNNDAVLEWASEAIAIKYRHPMTGKITSIFLMCFLDIALETTKSAQN